MVNISKIQEPKILDDVVDMSKDLYDKAYNLLKDNYITLDSIAKELILKETITEDELDKIIEENK